MKDFIGEKLVSVTRPWEDDCEGDEMILEFESGSLHVWAIDYSSQGCASLIWEEA